MSVAMSEALGGGFADQPRDAAVAFRAIMTAMARPGTILDVAGATPPPGLSRAAGAVLLTLADPDTGLWLAPSVATEDILRWIGFHTGAPLVAADDASFLLGPWDALPLDVAAIGTPAYPDRSATLIVEMAALSQTGPALTGPGIETQARLSLPDAAALRANAAQFPLGFDTILCAGDQLAALPRSTRIAED